MTVNLYTQIKPFVNAVIIVAIILVSLTAFISVAAKPDFPISNLYGHHWLDSSNPDMQHNTKSIAQHLTQYDVIIFGEYHGHPGIHLAQMQLMEQLHKLRPKLALSLEQFERDTQAVLDEYLSGVIGEQHMRENARAWDNYPTSYRALVEYAKRYQLPVIAANAPKEAVICVARKGLEILDKMTEEERKHVAASIDVSGSAYKEKYMRFLSSNPSHGGASHKTKSDDAKSQMKANTAMIAMAERSFAAQAVRDATMAESIASYMQNNPQHQLLHLTGHFHSKNFLGTVQRLVNRMPDLKVAVINPVSLTQEKRRWSKPDLDTGSVLLLVNKLPQNFVQEDNAMQWSREILRQRMDNECNIL